MSARDELEHYLTFSGHGPTKRKELIDAFAHELAEQIRGWAAVQVGGEVEEIYGYAADLIDPESEDYLGAGPVRPDEEPTP
jgi:hypothetical protein